jgi:hypothetical protein
MIPALAIIAGVIMALTVLHWILAALREGAVAEARIRDVEREMDLAARQADEVARERSIEDVANSADRGQF